MSKKKREKWYRVKVKIFEKYKYICFYCGIKCKHYPQHQLEGFTHPDDLVTIEHLYPRSDIRRILAGNQQKYLRVACTKCNTAKGKLDSGPLNDDPYREENLLDIISMLSNNDYSLLKI